jgi:NodT family efflux transporter outer membrane factor (OMF) lipoprotein
VNREKFAMKDILLLSLFCLVALLGGGCFSLSPTYAPPAMPGGLPEEYREDAGWKTAAPQEALERGSWWEMFAEPELNGLMEELNRANQSVAVAAANLRQARARVGVARSALFPEFSAPASATRSRSEGAEARTNYSYGASARWEISFWNVLPALEEVKAQAEASAADYAALRLAMQAELAHAYFQLRSLDSRMDVYEATITAYSRALQLTQSQLRGGIVTRMDVDQAATQLASAEAQLAGLQRQRAELEHGIAILTGRMPSAYSLGRGKLTARTPAIPPGLPSTLLERRPDIAAAERRVAAANEQIGLARAAWFPVFSLGSDILGRGVGWHSAPVWTWSVGPTAALTIFQGGRRLAESDAAWAGYEAEVANYRQTVLEAFRDVEDSLSALRHLEREAKALGRAVESSRSALRIAMSQYQGGMTTYLQVVNSQTAALTNESGAIDARERRLAATVNLIKALGGGFRSRDLERLVATPPAAPARGSPGG